MKQHCTHIPGDWTVNEAIAKCPQTIAVFNEFGIDSCCGGAVPIEIAAERDGVDRDVLLQRLNTVVSES